MKLPIPDKTTTYRVLAFAAAISVAFAAGRLSGHRSAPGHAGAGQTDKSPVTGEPTAWTCSMHPQIKLPKPGKCPQCFMDLIPLESHGGEDAVTVRELSISRNAARLMDIETVAVERRFVSADVHMVGSVDYDETRLSAITAWVPGRLDRLFVDYTGIRVKRGDHMVSLYSPELLGAQEELLQAINTAKTLTGSGVQAALRTTDATVAAAREKLRLLGVPAAQIKTIEEKGQADEHVTLQSPATGIVIHKKAREGMYVETGTELYTIADLSQVWVNLDAFAPDLAWLRYGQQVRFTTESFPGESFSGVIAFIHPVLDEGTRTVRVRLNVPNEDGRLKPGMFVRAIGEVRLAARGRVLDAALGGKWMCPMHPEIVRDEAEECEVCGMDLVRAESLGYVGAEPTEEEKPLVIPASAPLLTGKRSVVYVKVSGRDNLRFEGREVELGPRAGDYYVVREGLKEGERVVTRGAFKIDAELQIQAKPSMMTAADGHMVRRSSKQTHCPVMGGVINKDVYVDYKGLRIYFCCPGCETMFLEKAQEYLDAMRAEGVEPEVLK